MYQGSENQGNGKPSDYLTWMSCTECVRASLCVSTALEYSSILEEAASQVVEQ